MINHCHSLPVRLLVDYRTFRHFVTGNAKVVINRIVLECLQTYPLEAGIEEIFSAFSRKERVQTAETVPGIAAVGIFIPVFAPETIPSFVVLHSPPA